MSVCFPLGEQLFQTLCMVRDKTIQVFKRHRHEPVITFDSDDEDDDIEFSVYV